MNLFEQHLKLSDLAALIDQTLYSKFGPNTFWVKAETSDIKNYFDRQYCFLTLVEKEGNTIIAKMDAVIWRQQYHIIKEFSKSTLREKGNFSISKLRSFAACFISKIQ